MKIKRILCAILSVCIISIPFTASIFGAGAESISSLEQQLQELDQKNQEYQKVLDQAQSDINDQEKYNDALVSKIQNLDEKIAITRESIQNLNDSISQKQSEIDTANQEIQSQVDALCTRLRTIYMAGSASDLEIILGAKDFSDFVDKMTLVKTLSNYDKNLINDINDKLDKISEQKSELEQDKTDLEAQQASLESDQKELNETLEKNEEILRNLYSKSDDAKSAIENAADESDMIQEKISAYYAQQAAAAQAAAESSSSSSNNSSNSGSSSSSGGSSSSGSSSSSGGSSSSGETVNPSSSGFTWPCPGFYYLSSLFREDRISYYHGAIDIAGGGIMGAQVVAADGGTVIDVYNSCYHNWPKNGSCGCNGGYGNYVMIDHGNGKVTIYAHLTNAVVSTGQTVSKGQTLGYVGSTGHSTGAHLHFECRYNGVRYDPMSEY